MGALPARNDLMVSLGFAALALVEIGVTPPMGLSVPERFGEAAGAVLISGCFAFRRTCPVSSALLVLLLLAWAPTPAARNVITTPILIAMAIVGLEALRRETIREFPARQGAPSGQQPS